MDGARFDISIEANNLGVDASADQLAAFTEKIQTVNRVATEFDKVVAAARLRLDESAAAAKVAAAALQTAEARYKELESAANKAAKEVEKAALAGKATDALKIAAESAAEEMRKQAAVVDSLRTKSDAAAAAQTKLAGAVKTLEGQQSAAAARIKAGIAKEIAAANVVIEKAGKESETFGSKLSKSLKDITPKTKTVALGVLGLTAAIIAGGAKLLSLAGIKFDALTGALDDVKTMLTDGSSAAKGLRTIVDVIFGPLLDDPAKVSAIVKEMFKGLIYGALQVVIAVLKIRNEIFRAMSPETRAQIKSVIDQVFSLEGAFKIGTAVAIGLVVALVVLTAALIVFAIAELAALWPILLIVAAVAAVIAILMNWGAIVDWLKEMWDGFVAFIKRIPEAWVNAAKMMIDGLVKGIKDGAAAVWKAMQDLAGGAIDAFKSKLGIKSPSAVMRLQANYTTQGFVEGIDAGVADAEAAGASLAGAAATGASSGAQPRAQASGGSRSIVIQQLTIGDSPVAQSTFAGLKQALVEVLDGATITIGGGEAPAT